MKAKNTILLIMLTSILAFSSCKKEEIIEGDNITQIISPEIFHWSLEEDVILEINNVSSWSLDYLIAEIEVGALSPGDVIEVISKFRMDDNNLCDDDINVVNGVWLRSDNQSLPNDVETLAVGSYSSGTSEIWAGDLRFQFFHRSGAIEIEEPMINGRIGLWAQPLRTACAGQNVEVEVADVVVKIYRY